MSLPIRRSYEIWVYETKEKKEKKRRRFLSVHAKPREGGDVCAK